MAKVLEFQLQYQSFQWIFRVDFLSDWLVWTPCCPRASQESSPALQFERISSLALSLIYRPTLTCIHDSWETIALTIQIFISKVMSLLFNMLSRFVIAFPPKIRHLLISWLQCLSTVILEPRKIKSVTVSTVSPCICHEVMGPDAMILVFWTLNFKPAFSLSYFTLIKCSLVPLHFLSLERLSVQFSSVQFSCSVVSNSLRAHESQHTRPPCPLPTPGVHPNPCASSWWCHPAISSSVVPFSSCPQSFPASGSFPMSQPFASGGQMFIAAWFTIAKIWKQTKSPPTDERTKKIWYIFKGILCNHKKEQKFGVCNNINGLGGHYAKWSRSYREEPILYTITFIENQKNTANEY